MIVEVVPYNPNWPAQFEAEASILREVLGDIVVAIHHMGSTSVPGLQAKPIIDMLPEVTDLEALDALTSRFEACGYEVMGAYGIPGRRYFRKGGDHRTHHIHAFASGDPNIDRHLAFRDYLRAHPAVAQEYGRVKEESARRSNNDIEDYCDAKDPFIKLHEPKALAWYTP